MQDASVRGRPLLSLLQLGNPRHRRLQPVYQLTYLLLQCTYLDVQPLVLSQKRVDLFLSHASKSNTF
jgi:hypothetical protein